MPIHKPNLFIVGAAKAGTTSLNNYLAQHPDIYMAPIKEPHHFSYDIRLSNFKVSYKQQVDFDIKRYLAQKKLSNRHIAFIENREYYLELFRERKKEKYCGDGSNGYLYSKVAAKEIFKFNPHAKIIILLRNPVDRAFSHWLMDLRNSENDIKNFIKALETDYYQKDKGWGISHLYVELGQYFNQVKRYLDLFPEIQIKIFLYEDFKEDNLRIINEIFDFLELPGIHKIRKVASNKASIPKNIKLIQFLRKMNINNSMYRCLPPSLMRILKNALFDSKKLPVLSKRDREYVFNKYFKADVEQLKNFVNLDLEKWNM